MQTPPHREDSEQKSSEIRTFSVCRGLFLTESKLDAAIAKLNAYKANGNKVPDGMTDAEMWDARLSEQAAVEPCPGSLVLSLPFITLLCSKTGHGAPRHG